MTITISQQAHWELCQETVEHSHPDPDDVMDVVFKYPQPLGEGYWRQIELREGLILSILNVQLSDRLIMQAPEREHGFEWNRFQQQAMSYQLLLFVVYMTFNVRR